MKTLTGQADGKTVLTDRSPRCPPTSSTPTTTRVSARRYYILVSKGVGTPQYEVINTILEYADQVKDVTTRRSFKLFGTLKPQSAAIPPRGVATGYSDSLDKLDYQGATVGGLSSLAY